MPTNPTPAERPTCPLHQYKEAVRVEVSRLWGPCTNKIMNAVDDVVEDAWLDGAPINKDFARRIGMLWSDNRHYSRIANKPNSFGGF